jgi:hypothetical protein
LVDLVEMRCDSGISWKHRENALGCLRPGAECTEVFAKCNRRALWKFNPLGGGKFHYSLGDVLIIENCCILTTLFVTHEDLLPSCLPGGLPRAFP